MGATWPPAKGRDGSGATDHGVPPRLPWAAGGGAQAGIGRAPGSPACGLQAGRAGRDSAGQDEAWGCEGGGPG